MASGARGSATHSNSTPRAGPSTQDHGANGVQGAAAQMTPGGTPGLVRRTREPQHLFPGRLNHVPHVVVTPDGQPSPTNAVASVSEAGLPASGAEPAGSNAASNSETTTGTITYDAGDPPLVV